MSALSIGPVHHLRLTVNDVERSNMGSSRADLEEAVTRLDEWGVTHGEIEDLPPFGVAVLPLRDPDGIQLELTAPM